MDEQSIPDNAPRPRLCHVTKWPHFEGYGFNLHAEKSKPGQYIGKVDPGSPAERAGLKEGDRIIEVNGANINMENHKQVVQRIKNVRNETRLLVADAETEKFYRENEIVIRSQLATVLFISSELNNKNDNNDNKAEEELRARMAAASIAVRVDSPEGSRQSFSSESSADKKPFGGSTSSDSPRSTPSPEPVIASIAQQQQATNKPAQQQQKDYGGLNLNMSAAEMRIRIGSRKKRDPRKDDRMDFKKKYDIIQKL